MAGITWDTHPRKEVNMNIPEKLSLGKTLKVQRVLKNMTVKDVVAKTGIATSTYDNIESGKTKSPELRTLKKIAEALDMDLIYLTNLIGKQDEETGL